MTPWLRFDLKGQAYAIPLAAIVEVTGAQRLQLIPRIPLAIGGVMNVRGEPLPAVDGGTLLVGSRAESHRQVLVLERGKLRIGLLVGQVRRIELEFATTHSAERGEPVALVQWVNQDDAALGLVDPERLIERATMLLTDQRKQPGGQESWHTGF